MVNGYWVDAAFIAGTFFGIGVAFVIRLRSGS